MVRFVQETLPVANTENENGQEKEKDEPSGEPISHPVL
jgi:hypothetical protein